MSSKNIAIKQALIAEIKRILKEEPALVIERDGHKWVALQTQVWLKMLSDQISESTFRRWISKPPFVRRVFTVVEGEGHALEDDLVYENTLCLRLGEDDVSTMDRAKEMARIYRLSVPKKPGGWSDPGSPSDDPTKTGWKAPDRRDLFNHFMKLADLWGDDAPRIFRYVIDHWSDFLSLCEGVDRRLRYPSVRTMLRHEASARQLWAYRRKATGFVKLIAK